MIGAIRMAGPELVKGLAKLGIAGALTNPIEGALAKGLGSATQRIAGTPFGIKAGEAASQAVARGKGMVGIAGPAAPAAMTAQRIARGTAGLVATTAAPFIADYAAGQLINAVTPGPQNQFVSSAPIEPEVTQAGHATYDRLLAQQQFQAQMEQMRANNRIALAEIEKGPSHVYHSTTGNPLATAQAIFGRGVPQYG